MAGSSPTTNKVKSEEKQTEVVANSQAIPDTQISQPAVVPDGVELTQPLMETPRPGSCKRPRLCKTGTVAPSQRSAPVRFGTGCRNCAKTRSSLKQEIAKLRKLMSELSRNEKKLLDEIKTLKTDKEQLQRSVNFIQNVYTTLEKDHMELKKKNTKLLVKITDLKKIIN